MPNTEKVKQPIPSVDPLLDILLPDLPQDIQDLIVSNVGSEDSVANNPAFSFLPKLRSSNLSVITNAETEASIEKEQADVTLKLQDVVKSSYPKFISGSTSLASFDSQFKQFKTDVKEFYDTEFIYLDNDIQHFSTILDQQNGSVDDTHADDQQAFADKAFTDNSEAIVLLKNLDKLQDMLELPNLTLACVNNGYYTEALDLASHTSRLYARYSNIKVIQDIQSQVEDALKTMLVQLLRLLRETVKLPILIKVVSYLRRMKPFQGSDDVDRQLEQLYLVSRLQYIRTLLSSLEPLKKQSPETYLKRYIEVFREHVFVTIVGFRSVFPESLSSHTKKGTESTPGERLIGSFLRTLVEELRETVAEMSPFICDESTRNSLWLQVSYCSQSLGRVGGDFWPTIQGPLEEGSSGITKHEWLQALRKQKEVSKQLDVSASSSLVV